MHKSRRYIAVALLLLLVGISAKLLAQDQKMPSQEERAKAVNVVRLINTAELWYNRGTKTKTDAIEAHDRYASWDELNNSARSMDHGERPSGFGNSRSDAGLSPRFARFSRWEIIIPCAA